MEKQSILGLPQGMIDRMAAGYNEILRLDGPIVAAKEAHSLMDANIVEYHEAFFKAVPDQKIACSQGCSFCCYLHVVVTEEEAILLVTEEADKIDWEKTKLQSGYNHYQSWNQMSYQDRKCQFLTPEGRCGIYDNRPLSCRRHHVVGDYKNCNTEGNEDTPVLWLSPGSPEIVHLAVEKSSQMDGLANMLLKVKTKTVS